MILKNASLYFCFVPPLPIKALQRDRQCLQHASGAQVRAGCRGPRDLLNPLRNQLRDQVQDLRDRAGRARLHNGADEKVRGRHA